MADSEEVENEVQKSESVVHFEDQKKSKSPSPVVGDTQHQISPSSSAVDRLATKFKSSYGSRKYRPRYSSPEISDDDLEKPLVYKSFSDRHRLRSISPDSDEEDYNERRSRWRSLIHQPVATESSIEDTVADKKEPMKALEEAISDSYYTAKRTVDRCRSSVEVGDFRAQRKPSYYARMEGRFKELEDSALFVPRPSQEVNEEGERLYSKPLASTSARGYLDSRYAAPARDLDYIDPESDHSLTARPTYSRYTKGDPDYFDYDLESSVNMYKKWESNYIPQYGPRHWEHKLITELNRQEGVKPVAPYLFTKDYGDTRYQNTGYLNCAMRTPTFWANRFEKLLGNSVTYSSLASSGFKSSSDAPTGGPTSSYTYSSALSSPYELSSTNMRKSSAPKSRFLRDSPEPHLSDYSLDDNDEDD